jgi:hypothetical protein
MATAERNAVFDLGQWRARGADIEQMTAIGV